ncbi:MAG TPA: hypothetical protein VGM91_21425 [Conexibacter sp.]|jgi:hypothetical protein
MTRRRALLRGEAGQAAVEFVSLLPIVIALGIALLQALAAGAAADLADHAAEAGAVALARGDDAADAARASLPGWARDRMEVTTTKTRVRVVLTPPSLLPGLGKRLRSTVVADTGSTG